MPKYNDNILNYYNDDSHIGSLDINDKNVGTGLVGSPSCGDVMKLQIKVENDKIVDAKILVFGCGSAKASSSYVAEQLVGKTIDEALALAALSASVSHNHPEGIKGAQATAAAIYLAKIGASKEEIGSYIRENYYMMGRTLDEIRPKYRFHGDCQGSVPQSIVAFLESTDFEDAIRNVISFGGDADTMGAITGSIAWAYYGRNGITDDMEAIWAEARNHIPGELIARIDAFEEFNMER